MFSVNEISSYLSKASSIATSDKEGALRFLEDALKGTDAHVSYLGTRYISSRNLKGSVSLDKVIIAATKVFDAYRKNWAFSNNERKVFKALEEKIDLFYEKTDSIIKYSDIFTKFLVWLREFSVLPYTNRFFWEVNTRLSCNYTKEQWKQNFWYWDKPFSMVSHQPDVYYHQ